MEGEGGGLPGLALSPNLPMTSPSAWGAVSSPLQLLLLLMTQKDEEEEELRERAWPRRLNPPPAEVDRSPGGWRGRSAEPSSSSRSVNWYTSSWSASSFRKPLVTTPGRGSRRLPRWG